MGPSGWLACDGALLPISEYDALYMLLGTTYGGDGQQTFAVPDLRGRVPLHQGTSARSGTNYEIGQSGGSEQVVLTAGEVGQHNHLMIATNVKGNSTAPAGNILAQTPENDGLYATDLTNLQQVQLNSAAIQPAGGNQPHENCMPTIAIRPCIAYQGIYPSQN